MTDKATPTPGEIKRAKVALCHPEHPMVERVAQALATARERCAWWHDKEAKALREEAEKLRTKWGSASHVDILRRLADAHEASAAAIRRGEP